MRVKPHGKKRKKASKKQWREYLPTIAHLAAALYWLVRLSLLLWDRFAH